MWHALRAELAYFRPWLLGGLGIAFGIVTLLSVLVRLYGDEGPPGFVVVVFPVIAGMVVSFIAQSYRSEEHRARLMLAGPLTPRQLSGVLVLLPPCLVGLGALAAVPMMGVAALILGDVELPSLGVVAWFASQFLAYAQLGPLAQEASAARRQRRGGAAAVGWLMFFAAILWLAASQLVGLSLQRLLGQLIAVALAMVVAAFLYQRRTDFTR